jgi:hypothetical protein
MMGGQFIGRGRRMDRGQRIFIINIDDYAYLVPFIETEEDVFLKTIIPSRKATKLYLGRS